MTLTSPTPTTTDQTRSAEHLLSDGVEVTFVPSDPGRESWFAVWDPNGPAGMFEPASDASVLGDGWERVSLPLVRPQKRGTSSVEVTAIKVPVGSASRVFAHLPAVLGSSDSARFWAATTRFGLELVARACLLPWVSPEGWDTWRADPLDAEDMARVADLATALPAAGHCVASPTGRGRIVDPTYAIRQCLDAVADATVRSAADEEGLATPVFASSSRLRVRHLAPWVNDLSAVYCSGSSLLLRIYPPEPGSSLNSRPWKVAIELRSQKDPSLVVAAKDLDETPDEILSCLGDRVDLEVLGGLRLAVDVSEVLKPLLEQSHPTELALSEQDLEALLDDADALAEVGIDLHWPATLVTPKLQRRLVVGADTGSESALRSTLGASQLLDVDWEFLLDGVALTSEELRLLSDAKRAVVNLRGKWIRVDASTARLLRSKPTTMTKVEGIAVALGSPLVENAPALGGLDKGNAQVLPGEALLAPLIKPGDVSNIAERLRTFDRSSEREEPKGLNATLRPYQRQGLAWLTELTDMGLGGCLADDMGLGKTIQILALHLVRPGPTLVVCPTSLLNNWEREAAKFAPGVTVHRFHGPGRNLDALQVRGQELDQGVESDLEYARSGKKELGEQDGWEPGEIVLTTYGVVRSDAAVLATHDWDLVVADEAQQAKNPRSSTARSLRQIPSRCRIALTGTPVENHLTELWSIVDWILPGLFGNLERFRQVLAIPIEREQNSSADQQLHQLLQPFLLRRRKVDPQIAPELPSKTERDVMVGLTSEQVTLYRAVVQEAMAELSSKEGIQRHSHILSLLTALKQITNHPAQYLGEEGPLPGRSGKLQMVEELLSAASANGESTLIFSQFVTMGKLLVKRLRRLGVCCDLLHGGQNVAERQSLVDSFQAGNLDVLVLSLKAGGTGLNLTRATQVIHYDRWWNPAVEDQATDRAYRIGQTAPVTVHRLIAEGTVEDRVAQLLRTKRALSDRVLNGGTSWVGSIDDQDLQALVTLNQTDESGQGRKGQGKK